MQPMKLKNLRRVYEAVKTGYDSMMEPEMIEDTRTPVTHGDHITAIDRMFERADMNGQECWIP